MSGDNDAKELKRCFQSTIDSVRESRTKSQPLEVSTSDNAFPAAWNGDLSVVIFYIKTQNKMKCT
jgi:hypothetical protein